MKTIVLCPFAFVDAGSQDSDASMTKEKDDSNPHIKVEYGSPVDAWRTDMDDRMYRHSAEYDELNSYARVSITLNRGKMSATRILI